MIIIAAGLHLARCVLDVLVLEVRILPFILISHHFKSFSVEQLSPVLSPSSSIPTKHIYTTRLYRSGTMRQTTSLSYNSNGSVVSSALALASHYIKVPAKIRGRADLNHARGTLSSVHGVYQTTRHSRVQSTWRHYQPCYCSNSTSSLSRLFSRG